MKNFLFFILFLFVHEYSNGQILQIYDGLQKKPDTSIDLKFFKILDSVLIEKIDSFILLKNLDTSKDSGFITLDIMFNTAKKKKIIDCSFEYTYEGYEVTFSNKQSFHKVIGIGFYNNFLLIFTIFSEKLKIINKNCMLLKNIAFEHMPKKTQLDIQQKLEVFKIQSAGFILKRFYIN